MRFKLLTLLASTAVLLQSSAAIAKPRADTLQSLHRTLERWGKDSGIPKEKINQTVWTIFAEFPSMSKNGFAPIKKDLYVALAEDHNALLIRGKYWKGKPAESVECVILNGYNVITDGSDSGTCGSLTTVLFCPNEVRVIDYGAKAGYVFTRPKSPTKTAN